MKLEIIKEEPKFDAHPTPILFIHGMWHAAWCWAENFLPYFAQRGYLSYALSLRGHGASEINKKLRWTSISDYVSDVVQAVNQIGKTPIMIGHSMGGFILQKYLENHEAPAAVLLASAPPRGVLAATLRMLRRHPLAVLKANVTLSMKPVISTPKLAREAFFSPEMSEEKIQAYFSKLQDESYRAYLDMMFLNMPKPERIKTPLLVLGAAQDTIITTKEIEATAWTYNTKAKIFPNMAHDMMLDREWQVVADHILSWLKEKVL